jgi:hypothetical protein
LAIKKTSQETRLLHIELDDFYFFLYLKSSRQFSGRLTVQRTNERGL